MFGNRRKTLLVSAALVGGAMLMTACQDGDATADSGAAQGSSSATPTGDVPSSSGAAATGGGKNTGKDSGATGQGTGGASTGAGSDSGSGADTGGGKREPVEQGCGANDISWSTKSETQGGGYILITAKAKPGITCYLPAALPTVAFGSDGTEARPAEQSVGQQIKLSGNTAAYAGVNPKTTKENGGKELDFIIVAIGDDDPNPVSLRVGTITVDRPIVTNWHTAPADAVPSS
ncbi:hypothetical protein [Streptomyces sp. LaPpAH-108]|uniref:hypothetical protein n=1 Tax=Streptomyces sp. LaPpAH-108 TaxID=1155714 RepID=UPI00036D7513|nr:hypothetical protein [Streptomyces sp. LaPpAH-108]